MSTLSSPGLGSGLDVASLVQQLVSAERAPADARLNREQARANAQISALSKLKSALSSLDSFLSGIDARLSPRGAISADEDVFTASVTSKAATGRYDIEVQQLASAHRLVSKPHAADEAIGSGSLTLSLGEDSFTLQFSESATLAGIRDAINAHAENPGISATIVNGENGAHLVLSSAESGAAKVITVSAEGGDGGLDALAHDAGNTANYTESSPAADARVLIDGIAVTADRNVISDALQGVTLNLKAARPGEKLTLEVSRDRSALETALKDFVNSYNAVITAINEQTRFDVDAGTAAALTGDAMTRGIGAALRAAIATATPGADPLADTLAELGITTQPDGRLKLDSEDLGKALDAAPNGALELFGGESGLAARLRNSLRGYVESEGMFDSRTEALKKRLDQVRAQRDNLDMRMERLHQTYLKQFTALDTLLVQLQGTSSYIAQQLANL